jgi:hypothetical protein
VIICDLLDSVLPFGGSVLVYHLYADESENLDQRVMRVSGYLMTSVQAKRLTVRWAEELGELPYFHMKEGHWSKYPDVYSRLVSLISHDHMVAAFDVSANIDEYKEISSIRAYKNQPLHCWFGGIYSFLVGALAHRANRWLDWSNPQERDMAYFLDAGARTSGQADHHFKIINTDPFLADMKRELRYAAHSFVDSKRKDAGPLQAADMLAWNLNRALRDGAVPPVARPILAVDTYSVHYRRSDIQQAMQDNIDFCAFLGDAKRAKIVR